MRDLAELIDIAVGKGFSESFQLAAETVNCPATSETFSSDQIKLIDTYFADQGSDPGDEATVYLLEATSGTKGYLIAPDPFHVSPSQKQVLDAVLKGES